MHCLHVTHSAMTHRLIAPSYQTNLHKKEKKKKTALVYYVTRGKYLAYLLIPCSRVILEKLTGSQLVKTFPAIYTNRKFITAFTSARHMSLSWASLIQSMPSQPTSWRSILILFSIYAWVSQVVSFPQVSPPKPYTHLSSLPYALHVPLIPFFSILSPEQYWARSTAHQIKSQSIKKSVTAFKYFQQPEIEMVCSCAGRHSVLLYATLQQFLLSLPLLLSCSIRPSHLLCIVCFSAIITTVICSAVTN